MAAAEAKRKLSCACGKPLATFDEKGLNLYCRFSKETTTVPYEIAGLPDATAFVEKRRREALDGARGPRCQEEWTLTGMGGPGMNRPVWNGA
jgi:hypothetical protein